MERIAGILKVRPGEGRLVALVVVLMLATSAGGSVGGNAIEALFFARFGVASLPLLYVALGLVTIAMTAVVTAALGRVSRERLYLALPLGLAAVLVAGRLGFVAGPPLLYPLAWLAMNVMGSLQGLLTWGLAGLVCDTRQAKRLFPLFAAGGILGAVLGGFATRALAETLGSENLLLVWAAALGVAFAAGRALLRGRRPSAALRRASLADDLQRGWRAVRASELLRWMAVALVLFSVLYFSVAFPFSKAATAEYPDADALAGFLGAFQGASTLVAFLASLFVANRLFARIGIMGAMLAFTLVYLTGFGVLALAATFPLLIAFRFAQQAWLMGIAGSAYQAMFNVVPAERRDQTRAFLDGVPGQTGTVIAGLLLIVGDRALEPRQLYLVGLGSAALAALLVWRAARAYGRALADALRAGVPQVFVQEESPFGGFQRDAAAIAAVLAGLREGDPATRRVAAEIAAQLPERSAELTASFDGLLADDDAAVRIAAATGLLRGGPHPRAAATLRTLARDPDDAVRALALRAYGEVADAGAFALAAASLADPSPVVRRAAARASARADPVRARELLAVRLSDPRYDVREAAASALASLGSPALPVILAALEAPASEEAALAALDGLPLPGAAEAIRAYARRRATEALRDVALAARVGSEDDARALLADSLRSRARRAATNALRAVGLIGDREAVAAALRALSGRDAAQRANASELLEAAGDREIARPLVRVFELEPAPATRAADGWLAEAENDPDPWVRECAALVASRSTTNGGTAVRTLTTLAPMERILFLRKVPLFAELPPADLKQVAAIADERLVPDGEPICREGELGDELYVIVSGEVRVLARGAEVARRRSGEFVGEMAVISLEPRVATLVAAGDVRLLAIDRRQFEGLLRERPETGLSVMRVLAQRLREVTAAR